LNWRDLDDIFFLHLLGRPLSSSSGETTFLTDTPHTAGVTASNTALLSSGDTVPAKTFGGMLVHGPLPFLLRHMTAQGLVVVAVAALLVLAFGFGKLKMCRCLKVFFLSCCLHTPLSTSLTLIVLACVGCFWPLVVGFYSLSVLGVTPMHACLLLTCTFCVSLSPQAVSTVWININMA
jgi:hypothetical protein